MLYKYAQAVIFVYDITNKNSFVDIKDKWYEKVKEFAHDNCIFAVVGNKMDLVENEEVSKEEAKEYAESIGALWFLTSAKQGKGIEEIFKIITEKYVQINPKESFNKKSSFILEPEKIKKKKKFC